MADTPAPSPPPLDDYLRSAIAPRFRDLVKAAEQKLAAAQREVEDLRRANGSMAWEVTAPTASVCYLNIANGEMAVASHPDGEPFLTVAQSPQDWARFTAGVAQMGFLSGQSRRPFGHSRIERLRGVKGAIRFVLTGLPEEQTWSFTVYLGAGARPAEPQTTVTMAADLVTKIQSGQIDPQVAFMQGLVKLSGDPGLAMQLGMALFL